MKDIILVHDYMTPHFELENCWNFDYLYLYIENNFKKSRNVIHKMEAKYWDGVSVWIGHGTIDYAMLGETTTYELYNNLGVRIKGENGLEHRDDVDNVVYLYPVSPYGGGSCTFGVNHSLHDGRPFFSFIPEKTKHLLRTMDNFYLFINYSNEGSLQHYYFDVIYMCAEAYDIPLEKIIFSISDFELEKNYNNWFKQYKKNNPDKNVKKIKTMYHQWAIKDKAREIWQILDGQATTWNHFSNICTVASDADISKEKIRSKKFLMLNRRLRPHRIYSILLFSEYNMLDDFLISYDLENLKVFDWDVDGYHLKGVYPVKLMNSSYENLLKTKPESKLDYQDILGLWGFNFETKDIYLDSYINIVSETNFFELGGYFSEKTWKPMAHLQPFIFMGPAGSLKELKRMGFKTFSPFIDESYDDIRNNRKRFKALIEEIVRLSNLPIEEIHEWYHSIYEDVLLYNQSLFIEYRDEQKWKNIFLKNLNRSLDDSTR